MTAIDLERELGKIIEQQSLTALFQPIFNINTHQLHGHEALTRGPQHSPLYSPVPLFKLAETQGKLSELETLCRTLSVKAFKQRKLDGKLFINISPKALLDPDHPRGMTLQLVKQLGINPSDVVIELSEQYPADDIDLLKSCLNYYREQGFLTAIDDLGAGYSGLRLWSELAPDYVKIDRHFIHQIHQNPVKQEFVRSIVELCQSLTCKVIAEGIETVDELNTIKQLGVPFCQGYLLGRPNTYPINTFNSQQLRDPLPCYPRYSETAESLCMTAVTATPETQLKLLSEQFIKRSTLQGIVIEDNGHPLGIVNRSQLLELFSTPYGRALHQNHPASSIMQRQIIQIEASEPLSNVSQMLTSEAADTVAQQFVITREKKLLGIGLTKDLLQRITEHRIKMARHANPLTNLPGNVPIQEELARLKAQQKPFYLAYLDLCHFKPYNDIYGFSRGDEVIQLVASLLTQCQTEQCFIGHIGGDDFVLISTHSDIMAKSERLISDFEAQKSRFYSQEHWQAQTMLAQNRQGQPHHHPLVSLCIGVLSPQATNQSTEHQLSMLSAQAKSLAKHAKSGLAILCQEVKTYDTRQQKTA